MTKTIDRMNEASPLHTGRRDLSMPKNCLLYGIKIMREQEPNRKITYIIKYRDRYGKEKQFIWKRLDGLDICEKINSDEYHGYSDELIKSKLSEGTASYVRFLEGEAELNQYDDFVENGLRCGVPEVVLDVSWEQIESDLNYRNYKETSSCRFPLTAWGNPKDKFSDEWRDAELRKHPEYGPNGENAFQVKLSEITNSEGDTEFVSQHGIVVSSGTQIADCAIVSSFLEGKRSKILIGTINDCSKPLQLASELYPYCKWCFCLYGSHEDGYVKLDPPVNLEAVHWYSPLYEVCPRCNRKGTFEIVPTIKNGWDLMLGHPLQGGSVLVKGVTVFDLAKGAVIAVEGKDEYSNEDKSWVRWCSKLQVFSKENVQQLLGDNIRLGDQNSIKMLLGHAKLATHNSPHDDTDVQFRIAELFSEVCKQVAGTVVLLTHGLTTIYTNGDEKIRSSPIFQLDANGNLKFDMANNRHLQKFRNSLSNRSYGQGLIERIGTTPSRFRWLPKPTQNALPEK